MLLCFTASSQNSLKSTLNAGCDFDNGNGSLCLNITDISHGLDEVVGGVKPLVIVSCCSETATREVDYVSGQHETAGTSR